MTYVHFAPQDDQKSRLFGYLLGGGTLPRSKGHNFLKYHISMSAMFLKGGIYVPENISRIGKVLENSGTRLNTIFAEKSARADWNSVFASLDNGDTCTLTAYIPRRGKTVALPRLVSKVRHPCPNDTW